MDEYEQEGLDSEALSRYKPRHQNDLNAFTTLLPDARIPKFQDTDFSFLKDVLEGRKNAWRSVNSHLYWLQALPNFNYLQQYPENEHGTELLLTGSLYSHLFDAFWQLVGFPFLSSLSGFSFKWYRGADIL